MRYGITRLALGAQPFIEITPQHFGQIRDAKQNLVLTLEIEEKFDIFIENYVEFEETLLGLTLRHMVFTDYAWGSFLLNVRIVNRRIANLLSTARLYTDQVKHDVASLYGPNSTALSHFTQHLASAYDSSFSYRLLEELRNRLQHRSLPLSGISFPWRWEETKAPPLLRHAIVPIVNVSELQSDRKLKRKIVAEARELGSRFNLTPHIRQYVGLLAEAQEQLRLEMAGDVASWETRIVEVLDGSREEFKGRLTGLGIVAEKNDGIYSESHEVFEDLILHRKALLEKNRSFKKFAQRYVSGEATEPSPA